MSSVDESSKLLFASLIPTAAALIGIVVNSRKIERFRKETHARFTALEARFTTLAEAMESKFETLYGLFE